MITINSDTPYLGIAYAELLDFDIIQNLKEGFGMMGMRFTGKPTKAEIVKAYDEYVKSNPADVLRCLRPEDLELMDKLLKQGKGGHVTVNGTQIYNQLQKMNLVVLQVPRTHCSYRGLDEEEKSQGYVEEGAREFRKCTIRLR